MRFYAHIRSHVLRGRGGQHYWRTLEPLVRKMTDAEQEALFRVLETTKQDAEDDARRKVRTSPWRFMR